MAASISQACKHLRFLEIRLLLSRRWGPLCHQSSLSPYAVTAGAAESQLCIKRFYSARPPPQRPPTFFGKIIENLRDEMARNQKMKESLKEFRKDMEKLEKSEALQKAREKYQSVEEETAEGTKKARQQLESIKKRVSETVEEAQKTEILQKASKLTEEASKQAQKVTQTLSQKGEEISRTQTFKTISETAKAVKEEIDHSTFGGSGARVYKAPKVLRKRVERDPEAEQRIIQANTEAKGMVLHRDSQFAQSWQNFKDNNPYVNKVLVWKTRLDESDNPVVRASLLFKDKMTELFGGVFQRTELSEALTEICKMDPTFDKERFLLECEYDMIPNVLEAMIRPDLEVLQDWCYERAYSVLATPVKQAFNLGFNFDSKVSRMKSFYFSKDIQYLSVFFVTIVGNNICIIISLLLSLTIGCHQTLVLFLTGSSKLIEIFPILKDLRFVVMKNTN
ncbi:mitochondrial import inner membrane translocase subunit TIM44-like isoform X2 [Macrobrachium nipponense]|uniref:mitochondrial import inner membrane translocase subunit TIM44-like isoform X2 n=1 Tax=Macrobrachium nipponense TaxID=159736 RepID=UPI0030C80C3B